MTDKILSAYLQRKIVQFNKLQADVLFAENCILIGEEDVIADRKARWLLGAAAVTYVYDLSNKHEGNYMEYGIGDYSAKFLTLRGFRRAVTFHNIHMEEKQEGEIT